VFNILLGFLKSTEHRRQKSMWILIPQTAKMLCFLLFCIVFCVMVFVTSNKTVRHTHL